MINFDVYKVHENAAKIEPLSAKREWMDNTQHNHAYRCFPLSLTNQLGWGLSFPEDITFMWDGQSTTSGDNVKVLAGEKYCNTLRGHATVSFDTGLVFRTDENHSLLSFPVPNIFIDGATPMTTLLTTSFFEGSLPVAWKITKPFAPITIKANQPFIAVVPISLTDLQNSTATLKDINYMPHVQREIPLTLEGAMEAGKKATENGGWTDYYRDAVDYMGNLLGSHEVKAIRLNVDDKI